MKRSMTYNNYLNTIGLKKFTENELNLFFFFLKELNYEEDNELAIPYYQIKKETNLEKMRTVVFTNLLRSMIDKLIKITFVREKVDEYGKLDYIHYTIFNKFHIKEREKIIIIKISEDAIPLLNNFFRDFTKMDFTVYLNFKSKYSKEIYRHLRQFDKTRLWRVNVADFSELILVPEKYEFFKIVTNIIKPSIEELKSVYPDLRVNYIYEEKTGKRGRPKVKTLEFLYSKPKGNQVTKEVDLETGEIIEKEDLSINLSLEKKKELLLKLQQEILLEENNGDYPEWVTEDTKKIFNKTYSKV